MHVKGTCAHKDSEAIVSVDFLKDKVVQFKNPREEIDDKTNISERFVLRLVTRALVRIYPCRMTAERYPDRAVISSWHGHGHGHGHGEGKVI